MYNKTVLLTWVMLYYEFMTHNLAYCVITTVLLQDIYDILYCIITCYNTVITQYVIYRVIERNDILHSTMQHTALIADYYSLSLY